MRPSLHHKKALLFAPFLLLGIACMALSAPLRAQTPPPVPVVPAATDPAKPAESTRPSQVAPVRSLFFTMDEIRAIERAITTYAQRKNTISNDKKGTGEDFLEKLSKEEQPEAPVVERFFTYPQFFMESLVFHTPVDWSVRINNQKFTPDNRQRGNLEVINADQDKAVLQWRPADMDKVREIVEPWAEKPQNIDLRRGLVVFTLRPNQTFSSYVMGVLEGKVKPVVIDTNPTAGLTPSVSLAEELSAVDNAVAVKANPLDAYSEEVKGATNKVFEKLIFPPKADDKYKATAAGMVMECFNNCLTKGGSLNAVIPKKNCEALCSCMTTGLMEALGSEFTQGAQTPAVQSKGVEATKTCISKYQN